MNLNKNFLILISVLSSCHFLPLNSFENSSCLVKNHFSKMSQEQAHHINQIMEIKVIIEGEYFIAEVCEDDKIGEKMYNLCYMMEYHVKSNTFFMCWGVVLNPGFAFGFYKAQLFTQDNKIKVMGKKYRFKNMLPMPKLLTTIGNSIVWLRCSKKSEAR